eukprot:CAMPEP_0201662160 /NCGR_PEP_ID=MMETSP0494-20130426/4328_1 /ASSEMBLY_ACC=CAM_ASM_000839 /TAXON_ID=420259 /ORGANISM="Thalassiosira gravida, Strain GMp14c1" /LENGTH=626 /DNA_ID=CAMNT_0048140459 /DNA_START=80 /DNA_END=1960 /DNA_ORIENTATION=-
MATKFSFYLPSSAIGAETHKEVEKTEGEVDTAGETIGVEESFSASTSEDGGSADIVPSTPRVTNSKCETAAEEIADEEVVAEESAEVKTPSVAEDMISEVTTSGPKASKKNIEYEEEDLVEKGKEEERDDDEAYALCVEEERDEEESEEDGKQEERERSTVLNCDAEATQQMHTVPQSQSYVSEVTYEDGSPSEAACSAASTSSSAAQDHPVNVPRKSSAVSHRLASMMSERLEAMENIRSLLKDERDQENGMRAEFMNKVRVLEDEISSKDESIFELKTKNANHVRQLNRLTTTINELVDRNHANITQMTELDQDVAAKIDTIQAMNKDIQGKQSALDKKTDENVALTQQLEIFKAKNNDLKVTIEDLQAKHTDDANEQEVLMSSLQELVEQNTALEAQVEELVDANKTLESELIPTKQKHTQLLGTVDNLTESLNEVIKDHKKEFEELQKENEVAKQQMKEEQDTNAATTRQLEKILEETTAQMEGQLSAQKDTFKKQIADLNKALEETKTSCKKKSKRNDKLQKEIEDISRTAFKSAENAASTIVQLEKDLEEEFQTTTQLKRGMEDLKKKAQQDEDDKYTDDLEDLLASLRMVQCWQLSHFQRINKLVSENKEQARSIQLLG